jgi:hypothetical protein
MNHVLMPKATAVWLIENTALTFDQVSEFCGLHPLEVQSIADDETAIGMVGFDPIANGQLTKEEIDRCQADPSAKLQMAEANVPRPSTRTKGPRYTPVAKRQDKPDAIAWLVKNFPELSDGQIGRLIGTTKPTIVAVRDRTHWNMNNIKPRDPVALGLVDRDDLSTAIDKARRLVENAEKRAAKEAAKAAAAEAEAAGEASHATVTEPAPDAMETAAAPFAEHIPPMAPEPEAAGESAQPGSDNPFAALGDLPRSDS